MLLSENGKNLRNGELTIIKTPKVARTADQRRAL